MIEQINAELLKLQKELSAFSNSIDQIKKSGQLTSEVIEAAKKMQEDYTKQLDNIQTLFSEYMNKTYKHTEENVNKIFLSFQERLKEEEEILNRFAELSMQSENLTQELIKKITTDYKKQINSLIENAEGNINELKNLFNAQIKKLETDITKLIENHNKRLDTEQKVLDNYLDLAKSTAELSAYLKNIDFPQKLNELKTQITTIDKKLSELDNNIKQNTNILNRIIEDPTINNILEYVLQLTKDPTAKDTLQIVKKLKADTTTIDILEKTKRIKKKTATTNTLTWIILIFVVFYSIALTFVFFYFFPDFFTTIFGG